MLEALQTCVSLFQNRKDLNQQFIMSKQKLERIIESCQKASTHKDYCDKLEIGQGGCNYARGIIHIPAIKLGIQGYIIKYRCMHYTMHKTGYKQ